MDIASRIKLALMEFQDFSKPSNETENEVIKNSVRGIPRLLKDLLFKPIEQRIYNGP